MASYQLWATDTASEQACVIDGQGRWYLLHRANSWAIEPPAPESLIVRWALGTPIVRRDESFTSLDELHALLHEEAQQVIDNLRPSPIASSIRSWPDLMFSPWDKWNSTSVVNPFFWAYMLELAARFPAPGQPPLPGWEFMASPFTPFEPKQPGKPGVHKDMIIATRVTLEAIWGWRGRGQKDPYRVLSALLTREGHSIHSSPSPYMQSLLQSTLVMLALTYPLKNMSSNLMSQTAYKVTSLEIVRTWKKLYEDIHNLSEAVPQIRDVIVGRTQLRAEQSPTGWVFKRVPADHVSSAIPTEQLAPIQAWTRSSAEALATIFGFPRAYEWLSSLFDDRNAGVQRLCALYARLKQLDPGDRTFVVTTITGEHDPEKVRAALAVLVPDKAAKRDEIQAYWRQFEHQNSKPVLFTAGPAQTYERAEGKVTHEVTWLTAMQQALREGRGEDAHFFYDVGWTSTEKDVVEMLQVRRMSASDAYNVAQHVRNLLWIRVSSTDDLAEDQFQALAEALALEERRAQFLRVCAAPLASLTRDSDALEVLNRLANTLPSLTLNKLRHQSDGIAWLRIAVSTLPQQEQAVLLLSSRGATIQEIADVSGIADATAGRNLLGAQTKFRRIISKLPTPRTKRRIRKYLRARKIDTGNIIEVSEDERKRLLGLMSPSVRVATGGALPRRRPHRRPLVRTSQTNQPRSPKNQNSTSHHNDHT